MYFQRCNVPFSSGVVGESFSFAKPSIKTMENPKLVATISQVFKGRPHNSGFQSGCFSIIIRERSEEHTSELQSRPHLVCRLLLEKKKKKKNIYHTSSIISYKLVYSY